MLDPDLPKANSFLEVKVSAMTNEDIVDGYIFLLAIGNKTALSFLDGIDICTTVKCPTKVFNLDIAFILKNLPSSYLIEVEIGDKNNALACGFAQ
ncbi:36260_t:CDS:1, partial [Racocetra persica]